jgi:hypothetical protein
MTQVGSHSRPALVVVLLRTLLPLQLPEQHITPATLFNYTTLRHSRANKTLPFSEGEVPEGRRGSGGLRRHILGRLSSSAIAIRSRTLRTSSKTSWF